MKHNFLTSSVLVVMSFGALTAQENLRVKSFIGRRFETDFAGASRIEWKSAPSHYVVLFTYHNEVWLAFYSIHGEMLASGRRLSTIRELPLQVQLGITDAKRKVEKEFGMIATSFAIELVERGDTKYLIPVQNGPSAIMICSDDDERTTIKTRILNIEPSMASGQLLVRSN